MEHPCKSRGQYPQDFYIVLMSEGIAEQQLWEGHQKKYDLIVKKATNFKKQCVSHRTLIKTMTELRPGLLEEAVSRQENKTLLCFSQVGQGLISIARILDGPSCEPLERQN